MGKKKPARLSGNTVSGFATLLASLECIVLGLVVGYIALLILGAITAAQGGSAMTFGELLKTTWEKGFKAILQGGFFKTANTLGMGVRMEIIQAAPLIMTGLSVAFAFKTGLFNIGAAGQYTVGAFFALYSAIVLKMPWWACLIASMLGGALWGAIPGIFKAYLNVNEVITSIMFNWIGLYAVNTLIYQGGTGVMYNTNTTKTHVLKQVSPGSVLPTFNIPTGEGKTYFGPMFAPTIGIFIAIAVAVLVWVVVNKTVFGYELRACGLNKNAAEYAGIADKRNIVLSMAIAGALSGAAASLYYLSGNTEFFWSTYQTLPATGFNGIPVALLAVSNPIGVIFTGCFMSMLDIVGLQLTNLTAYNEYITDVIIAIIVYLSAFSLVIKMFISGQRKRRSKAALPAAEAAAKPPEGGGGAEVEKGGESA